MRTPPGAARLRDVAERAGVHPATASRALREATRHQVAAAASARVIQAAADLGYVPNHVAVSLRTQRTRTVTVLAGGPLDSPETAQLLAGAEEALRADGYMTVTAAGASPHDSLIADLAARRTDGIIATPPAGPVLAAAGTMVIPVVAAGESHSGIPSAAPDLAAAAALAAGHLAALGHRLAVCVSCPAAPLTARLLEDAAVAAGLTVRLKAATVLSVGEGRRCCRELIASGVPFTAILAGSDLLAAGCCAELAAAARPCPAAVSVTGAGDLPLSESLPVPLTTVALPWREAGAAAARLLTARLRDPAAPAQAIRLTPGLIQRGSTRTALHHQERDVATTQIRRGCRRRGRHRPGLGNGQAAGRPVARMLAGLSTTTPGHPREDRGPRLGGAALWPRAVRRAGLGGPVTAARPAMADRTAADGSLPAPSACHLAASA